MEKELIFKGAVPETPLLSIVIPTYKNMRYLDGAIDSIIGQSEKPFDYEIIVTSNYTEADYRTQADKYAGAPVCFYKNSVNLGQVGNINKGMERARGKYVAYLHDDDLLLPNYFSSIAKYIMDNDEDYPCLMPSFYKLGEIYNPDLPHRFLSVFYWPRFIYRRELQKLKPEYFYKSIHNIYGPPTCGTVFLKKAVEEYGGFRDERGAAWDTYNFRMFNARYIIYRLHKYTGVYRVFSGMSNNADTKEAFKKARQMIYDEEFYTDHPCFKKIRSTLDEGKPLWKFVILKAFTKSYYYLKNLDYFIGIPKPLFDIYSQIEDQQK